LRAPLRNFLAHLIPKPLLCRSQNSLALPSGRAQLAEDIAVLEDIFRKRGFEQRFVVAEDMPGDTDSADDRGNATLRRRSVQMEV
jgi:hypothetical protein